MPYDHDMSRELRRLIPLGISSVIVSISVAFTLVDIGVYERSILWPVAAAVWLPVLGVQAMGTLLLTLLVSIILRYDMPIVARLPTLLAFSAGVGAAVFGWASPWIGAACGLVTLTGWLYSIRDRLA